MTGDILARLRALIGAVQRSDGDARPSPYDVTATQAGHILIGLLTALALCDVLPPGWAVLAAVALWGGAWEAVQYIRRPSVRTLRDWLLGDLPAYAIGAVGVLGMSGAWVLAAGLFPIIAALIFGRVR